MMRSLKIIEAHVNNVTYLFIKYLLEISCTSTSYNNNEKCCHYSMNVCLCKISTSNNAGLDKYNRNNIQTLGIL